MHMNKIMQQCCACGKAKFQLAFKGVCSAQTYKKDYPSVNTLSSITVGDVHNSNYTMFGIGSYANCGLSELVLTAETHIPEQELANEIRNRESVGSHFLMPGSLWYQAIRVNHDYLQICVLSFCFFY